ncbi:MAG: SDR family NAD(P)-dependent oxidoreductase [Anaerolineales bacterium]
MTTAKVIVITGSTKGIGLGLAESFLQLGCRVVISGRNPQALDAATQSLQSRYASDALTGAATSFSP